MFSADEISDNGAGNDESLISDQGIAGLWALAEDPDRLTPAERALLALALGELEERRKDT
jgi:hypothetical protein